MKVKIIMVISQKKTSGKTITKKGVFKSKNPILTCDNYFPRRILRDAPILRPACVAPLFVPA